jgi:hypothetical protein
MEIPVILELQVHKAVKATLEILVRPVLKAD